VIHKRLTRKQRIESFLAGIPDDVGRLRDRELDAEEIEERGRLFPATPDETTLLAGKRCVEVGGR
jgi:hypothetical protein